MSIAILSAIYAGMFGTPQIILIVVVVLLLFGGKKIPQLMKGLGQGMKEFKNASGGEDKKDDAATTATTTESEKS